MKYLTVLLLLLFLVGCEGVQDTVCKVTFKDIYSNTNSSGKVYITKDNVVYYSNDQDVPGTNNPITLQTGICYQVDTHSNTIDRAAVCQ